MDADVGVELGVLLGGMGVGLTLGMISAFALLFRFDEVKLEMEGPQAAL